MLEQPGWQRELRRAGATLRGIPQFAGTVVRTARGMGWPIRRSPTGEQVKIFEARHYAGSRRRRYTLFVPPRRRLLSRSPLVLVLHGCLQTENQIRHVSAFDELARQEGFIVAYPRILAGAAISAQSCWPWWDPSEIQAGAGAVEDLFQIIQEIRDDYRVDPDRIHVAGLSAGGAMALAMLVAHAGQVASGCAVAGVPYGESAAALAPGGRLQGRFRPVEAIVEAMNRELGGDRPLPPAMVVHATGDTTVDITAARHIRDSWLQCAGPGQIPRVLEHAGHNRGTRWQHAQYFLDGRRSRVETILLEGLGHGWYGGRAGSFSFPRAPDISRIMWDFFRQHPRR